MGCLTGLFYVVTGIQYWLPNYLATVIKVTDATTVSLYFVFTTLSAPIGGVIVGGIITQSFGGYNTEKAMKMQCLMGACAVICALPIPFFDNFYYVGMLFWGVLFFGGFVLPPVTGIMIDSVKADQRASANSIANLTYNLLGYFPAAQVYGYIAGLTEKYNWNSKWAMGALLYSTILTIGLLFTGINKKLQLLDQSQRDSQRGSIQGREEAGLSNFRNESEDSENADAQEWKKNVLGSGDEGETDPLNPDISEEPLITKKDNPGKTTLNDLSHGDFSEPISPV